MDLVEDEPAWEWAPEWEACVRASFLSVFLENFVKKRLCRAARMARQWFGGCGCRGYEDIVDAIYKYIYVLAKEV